MDLEKTYDTIDQYFTWKNWKMLRVYGVLEKLLNAMHSFYVGSRANVRVGSGFWLMLD